MNSSPSKTRKRWNDIWKWHTSGVIGGNPSVHCGQPWWMVVSRRLVGGNVTKTTVRHWPDPPSASCDWKGRLSTTLSWGQNQRPSISLSDGLLILFHRDQEISHDQTRILHRIHNDHDDHDSHTRYILCSLHGPAAAGSVSSCGMAHVPLFSPGNGGNIKPCFFPKQCGHTEGVPTVSVKGL